MAKGLGYEKLKEQCWLNYGEDTMNIENLTDKLKSYRYEVLNLARVNDKIKAIRELTQTPSSTKYDGVRSANTQTLNDKIANLVDLEFEFINKSAEIQLELSTIEAAINKLDTKYALVLKYFYLDGYTIKKIARIMSYDETNIYKIKKEAIERLGEII
jgi:DNA-directed RNA polymerase specialized sigma24 family protein